MSWLNTDDAAVFAPFRDYLGLLNLVKVRVSPAPSSNTRSSVQQVQPQDVDDFESNGVTVDCGDGLMPFTVPGDPQVEGGRWGESDCSLRTTRSRFYHQYHHRRSVLVTWCVFCRNNGETESIYTSHVLKDSQGKTTCPILRAYACPICGAKGDGAHTIKYCPARGCEEVPPAPLKTARTSTGFRKVSTRLACLQPSVGAVGERRY